MRLPNQNPDLNSEMSSDFESSDSSTTSVYGSYPKLNENSVKKIRHSSKLKPTEVPLSFHDDRSLPINSIDQQNLDERMIILNTEFKETACQLVLTIQQELLNLSRFKGLTKKKDYSGTLRNHSLTWPERSHQSKFKLFNKTIELLEEMLTMTMTLTPMNHGSVSPFMNQLLSLSIDKDKKHSIVYESVMSVIFQFSTLTRIINVIVEQKKLISMTLDTSIPNTPIIDKTQQSDTRCEAVPLIRSHNKPKYPFFKMFKKTFRKESRATSSSESIDSFKMTDQQIIESTSDLVMCRLCEERIDRHTFERHIQLCTIEKTCAVEIYALNMKLEKYLKLLRSFRGSQEAEEMMRKIEKRVDKVLKWATRKLNVHKFKCQLKKLEILLVDALENWIQLFNVDQMSLFNAILSKSREKMEAMNLLKTKVDEFWIDKSGSREFGQASRLQYHNSRRSSIQSTLSLRPKGFLSVLSAILTSQSNPKLLLESKSHVPSISDFQIISPIDSGGYGKVYLAKKLATQDIFAIKILEKEDMIKKNMTSSVLTERKAQSLSQTHFIVPLFYAFQNQSSLFLVMEFMVGGDLGGLLFEFGVFDKDMVVFYAAEMTLALSYLHENGIIHRDIKPDNVLIASNGHCKLTDFGLSKIEINPNRQNSIQRNHTIRKTNEDMKIERMLGTPDYLSPELLLGMKHTYAVDWWALGCCIYEFILGYPPFTAESPELIFRHILAHSIHYPSEMDEETIKVLKELLIADPSQRGNAELIQSSHYFDDVKWGSLYQSKPPFIPKESLITDKTLESDFQLLRQSTIESVFEEFNYVNIDVLKNRR